MRVWIVTIGESLPIGACRDRAFRSGMLADMLVERGHDVTLWTSTFDHLHKKQAFDVDTFIDVSDRLHIRAMHSVAYSKNVSARRVFNHMHLAHKFRRLAAEATPPDLILCSLPTIDLSVAATDYAVKNGIPVALDVRDLWPDIFIDVVPHWLKPVAKIALKRLRAQARTALRNSTSIIGISDGYLTWALSHAGRSRRSSDAVFPLGYSRASHPEHQMTAAMDDLRQRGVDPAKKVCWFVGTFGRTYDLATVIEAARIIEAQGRRDLQFVLSGSGEEHSRLARLAKDQSNVMFTGWVDPVQIACLSRAASIGLMAYAEGAPQGYPNKLFEYLSGGLPILSSLRGETEALLQRQECGRTYAAGRPDLMASELVAMCDDEPALRTMAVNSAALFEASFAAHKVYTGMSEFLEVLQRSARAAAARGSQEDVRISDAAVAIN